MKSINFGERIAFLLSDELKENLMHKFSFYQNEPRQIEKLPNLNILEQPYLICTPTLKNYYLFLTSFAGNKYSLIIDTEENECYFARFRFDKELFTDTLFQGEFVIGKNNKWIFRVNDLLAMKGQQQSAVNFSDRLLNVKSILDSQYIWDEYMNICHIEIKPFCTYDFLPELGTFSELWFVPQHMFDPIYSIKFGEKEAPEIQEISLERELWLHNAWKPDLFEVKDDEDNNLGYAYIKSLNDSKVLRKLIQKDAVKLKCIWNDRFNKWMPILTHNT